MPCQYKTMTLGVLILLASCSLNPRGAIQIADRQWKSPSAGIRTRAAREMSCDAAKVHIYRVKRFRRSARDIRWAYNLFHVEGCGKGRNYLQGCSSRGCGWTLSPEMAFCLERRCPLERVQLSYLAQGRFLVEGCRARKIYTLFKGMWIASEPRD